MAFSQRLFGAIVNGKPPLAKSFVEEELAGGADPLTLWTGFAVQSVMHFRLSFFCNIGRRTC